MTETETSFWNWYIDKYYSVRFLQLKELNKKFLVFRNETFSEEIIKMKLVIWTIDYPNYFGDLESKSFFSIWSWK